LIWRPFIVEGRFDEILFNHEDRERHEGFSRQAAESSASPRYEQFDHEETKAYPSDRGISSYLFTHS
jgi:hypothetical protein